MSKAGSADTIAEFVASTSVADIPTSVLDTTRWLLLDSFACALAATSLLPEVDALLGAVGALGSGSDSTLIGVKRRSAPAAAAFVNGGLVHGLNYDAVGPNYAHVAAGTVPSALAVAEASGTSGRELLAAVALAAEVSCRLTVAAADPLSTQGWLMGQLLAVFSSALGAARATGLDARATASALGVALMQAGGTTQVMADGGAPAKSVYAAFPALSGVVAAATAGRGLDATMDVFDGRAGLFARFLPDASPSVLTEGLGSVWYADAVEFKRWPNTAVAHPFLHALVDTDAGRRTPTAVAFRIGHERAAFFDPDRTAWRPSSVGTAGNSVPYAVACQLVNGAFDLDSLRPEAFHSVGVLDLLDETAVEWHDGETDEIELTFGDGGQVHLPISPGQHVGAQPGHDLLDKLRACGRRARHSMSDDVAMSLLTSTMELEGAEDLTQVQRALTPD